MCVMSLTWSEERVPHALKVPAALTLKEMEKKKMIQMESLVAALRPMFPFISCFLVVVFFSQPWPFPHRRVPGFR